MVGPTFNASMPSFDSVELAPDIIHGDRNHELGHDLRTFTIAIKAPATRLVMDEDSDPGNTVLRAENDSVVMLPQSTYATSKDRVHVTRGLEVFTTTSLQAAMLAWCTDPSAATGTYGDIAIWDTSSVGSMNSLIYSHCGNIPRSTFNAAGVWRGT